MNIDKIKLRDRVQFYSTTSGTRDVGIVTSINPSWPKDEGSVQLVLDDDETGDERVIVAARRIIQKI